MQLDFKAFAQRIASEGNAQMMLPVIEKELLHYEIIQAMEKSGLLSNLVFQGGTCLRLCYGAPRYSEDLDFVGGVDFSSTDLGDLKDCITQALPERYAVSVKVIEPQNESSLVKKWNIRIDTAPQRSDLPAQKISVEVASVPAYTRHAKTLQLNYEGLPSSYGDIILFSESLEEILADKLEAFICSSYIRHRDIWDMYWIMRRPNINLQEACELRKKKEIDYGEQEQFKAGFVRVTEQLDSIVNGREFADQMKRFLPVDLHKETIGREEFCKLLVANIQELYVSC